MKGFSHRPGLAERMYRVLLLLYPPEFRRIYSADLVQAWRDMWYAPGRSPSPGSSIRLWFFFLRDSVGTAFRAWTSRPAQKRAALDRPESGPGGYYRGPSSNYRRPSREFSLSQIYQDIRFAVRQLSRKPAFTIVVVITLALGIGANAAIFTVINSILIQPLPYPEQDALVSMVFRAPGIGVDEVPHSEATYLLTAQENRVFEAIGIFDETALNLTGEGAPERVVAIEATHEILSLLRAVPLIGRLTNEEDGTPGSPEVVILTHELWQRRLGGDPSAVGRTMQVNGVASEIVGILKDGFRLPVEEAEMLVPFRIDRSAPNEGNFSMPGLARLKGEVSMEMVDADISRIIDLLPERFTSGFSKEMLEQVGIAPNVRPLKEYIAGDVSRTLWILLAAVCFVLLIACANVANLFLVRAEGRQREVAVRTAIGASGRDLARHFLAESVTLGVMGGAVGLFLAWVGTRALVSFGPDSLPRLSEIGLDAYALLFTLAVSLLAGGVFGLFPVVKYRKPNLAAGLKEGGRGGSVGKERHRARSVLVVSQMALALILLVGSGLMFKSFQALRSIDPGFDPTNVLTLRLTLPDVAYPDSDSRLAFYDLIQSNVLALPGVESVGAGQFAPLAGEVNRSGTWFEDIPVSPGQLPELLDTNRVTPGYLETLGIRLIEGRHLNAFDAQDRTGAVVVTKATADRYWPGQNVIGRRLTQGTPPHGYGEGEAVDWQTIVGVVQDVRFQGMDEEPIPFLFFPLLETGPAEEQLAPSALAYFVRTTGNPIALLAAVRQEVWALDSNLPIADIRTMDSVVKASMSRTSFTMVLLGIAALVALLLGSVGIYGVISYVVSQRTREMGIRLALGAEEKAVAGMVVKQGAVLAAIGIAVGLMGAYGLTRLMGALLFSVSATDPFTFGGVAVALAIVALVASYLPARRAARTDPVAALRNE